MTKSSAAVDLDAAKAGVEAMYVAPEERVLDPTKADQSLLERMPSPSGWRMLVLPYRGKGQTSGGCIFQTRLLKMVRFLP